MQEVEKIKLEQELAIQKILNEKKRREVLINPKTKMIIF